MRLLLLARMLLPGCWAMTAPRTVWGFLGGGSLLVNCTYWLGQEMKPKFWCKPATFYTCDADIVITSEQHPVVEWDRFSIRDNRAQRVFTVTMERLAEGDAGTYPCGVRMLKLLRGDSDNVEVLVSPAPPLSPTLALPPTTTRPPAAGADAPRGTPGHFRYFPVLAGLQVLALLATSGAVFWVSLWGG